MTTSHYTKLVFNSQLFGGEITLNLFDDRTIVLYNGEHGFCRVEAEDERDKLYNKLGVAMACFAGSGRTAGA